MQILRAALMAGMLCLVGNSHAAAATPLQKYQQQVAKVAPASDAKPKALCMCSVGGTPNAVGFVRQVFDAFSGYVIAVCAGNTFDGAGQVGGDFSCGVFTPLGR
jgi:hypothetical protein